MPTNRLFFAIRPSATVRDEAIRLIRDLAPLAEERGLGVAWVPGGNLHVTLRFLGAVEEARFDAVRSMGASVARAHAGFELRVGGLGAFPTEERPRSIWVGLAEDETDGAPRLTALANELEREARALGFSPEKRDFSPHLTIGRVKTGGGQVRGLLDHFRARELGGCRIEEMVLFESRTRPAGSVYVPLASWPISGSL